MRWFAKSSIIIWIEANYPMLSNKKFRLISQMPMRLIFSEGFNTINIMDVQLNEVKTFDSISPSQMAEFQKEDTQLSLVYECVNNNSKPKLSEIHCIRSKPIWYLLLQFDQLSLIRGVLHHCSFMDDDETYQLILPQHLCNSVLRSLHDDNGHQGL